MSLVAFARRRFWALLLTALLGLSFPARALTLYSTDFEEFPVGSDKWAGTSNWLATSTGVGVHGIDQDLLPGLGRTAYLGYNRPKSTFVTVFRRRQLAGRAPQ